MHDILMITYNRAAYTRLSLPALLDSCDGQMRVWVWHNGSDAETLEVVRDVRDHPRFHHLEVSPQNLRLREPTNWFWRETDGEYVTKVDDDCLLPDGWGKRLRDAHEANPRLGAAGCWRFLDEDYVPRLAERKMKRLEGDEELLTSCWIQGSGYVMKRACMEENGPLQDDESFTQYCIRSALKGWQHGWLYPFLHEEHMDDPRSEYCLMKSDEEFMAGRPLSAIRDNITTLDEWAERVRDAARYVQGASSDPKSYVGWRKYLQGIEDRIRRVFGTPERWRRLT